MEILSRIGRLAVVLLVGCLPDTCCLGTGREIVLSHDLGEIRWGETYEHTFHVKNTFSQRFVVKKVNRSCGCTSALVSRNEIPVGEIATVPIRAQIGGRRYGTWDQEVAIVSEDGRTIRLQLAGRFPNDGYIVIEPEEIDIGKVRRGSCVRVDVSVLRRDGSPLAFQRVDASSTCVAVDAPIRLLSDGEQIAVPVKIDTTQRALGIFSEKLTVITEHPQFPSQEIRVKGEVISSIQCTPARLFLGNLSDSDKTYWGTTLQCAGGSTLHIISATHTLGEGWEISVQAGRVELKRTSAAKPNSKFVKGEIRIIARAASSHRPDVPTGQKPTAESKSSHAAGASLRQSGGSEEEPPMSGGGLEHVTVPVIGYW